MPSTREIAITIKGSLSTGGNEPISFSRNGTASAISSDEIANRETSKYSDATDKKGRSGVSVLSLYAYKTFKNNLMATASQLWNRYVNMKEDYLAQNNMNEIKAHVGAVKSYATAAITGAKLGSAFGPVGTVVGAAIGTVGNVVNRAVSFSVTMANYNEQNNAMNAQTNFSRVRMGLMDGGRGTEN